jgi:hypothetical protein
MTGEDLCGGPCRGIRDDHPKEDFVSSVITGCFSTAVISGRSGRAPLARCKVDVAQPGRRERSVNSLPPLLPAAIDDLITSERSDERAKCCQDSCSVLHTGDGLLCLSISAIELFLGPAEGGRNRSVIFAVEADLS